MRSKILGIALACGVAVSCAASAPDRGPPPPLGSASAAGGSPEVEVAPPRLPADTKPLAYRLDIAIDPSQARFDGKVTIDVELTRPRREILLHGRDIEILSAEIRAPGAGQATRLAPKAMKVGSVLSLGAAADVAPGRYELALAYSAPFAEGLSGLFRLESGGEHYAFTQFEALDARRAFPCFDEPGFKTPFEVTMLVRKDDVAIGNTRAVATEPAGPDKKRVRFAKSEPLPTYLVAFAVGPFDVVDAKPVPATSARGKPLALRGVAVRGKGSKLAFALDRHAALLAELERYFGTPYPYDKLDVIAVPDFPAGAMENAGAITYKEALLLVDAASGTETQRRDVVGVAAHELAHQWFGNLVTMAWWDDLWLNEAFATWMGQRAVEKVHPEWRAELESIAWTHEAMEVDSLVTARAIRQPIVTDDDIENAFDPLTYSKGAALIAMYERFVGEDAFRAGVRRYLDKHRFSNATTDDFLGAVFDGKPEVARSFRTFLDRPGVPRVAVTPACDGAKLASVKAEVSRFLPLGSTGEPNGTHTVPLCVRLAGAKAPVCGLIGPDASERDLPMQGGACPAWLFPNADGVAYARWSPSSTELRAVLDKGFGALTARERLAVADSLRSGLFAGTLAKADVLTALAALARDPDREVAFAPAETLRFVRDNLVAPSDAQAFGATVAGHYAPILQRLGWDERAGESGPDRLVRAAAVSMLADVARDPKTRAEALKRARSWLGIGGAASPTALAADVRETALVVAAQDGGMAAWQALRARLAESDDALLRRQLLIALASADDDDTAAAARAFALGADVRKGERLRVLFTISSVAGQRRAFWGFLKAELGRIKDGVPEFGHGLVPLLAQGLCDASLVPEVRAAFAPHLSTMVGAPRSLDNAAEAIRICAAVRAHHLR